MVSASTHGGFLARSSVSFQSSAAVEVVDWIIGDFRKAITAKTKCLYGRGDLESARGAALAVAKARA
jgi:hypothetical protein